MRERGLRVRRAGKTLLTGVGIALRLKKKNGGLARQLLKTKMVRGGRGISFLGVRKIDLERGDRSEARKFSLLERPGLVLQRRPNMGKKGGLF